jgi:hypothetical protein
MVEGKFLQSFGRRTSRKQVTRKMYKLEYNIEIDIKEIGWRGVVPIAEAFSHRLPTTAARAQPHVRSCGYSPSTSLSPVRSHSTSDFVLIYHPIV